MAEPRDNCDRPRVTSPLEFATEMVAKLQAILRENVGSARVNVDGNDVEYRDLEVTYAFWQRKLLIARGKCPTVSRIRLDRF